MPVGGIFLIVFGIIVVILLGILGYAIFGEDSTAGTILIVVVCFALICGVIYGVNWYYNNTSSGQRAVVDYHSEVNNGLERTINIYTANGDLIATYSGKIDMEGNNGGYVLFDFEGKRYTYYNCFVESIADIN